MYKKIIFITTSAFLIGLISSNSFAQEKEPKTMSISLKTDGLSIDNETKKEAKKDEPFKVKIGVVDLGLNTLRDKSDYTSAAAKGFLKVPSSAQNENLFDLRGGKSWNVNVWPVLLSWAALNGKKQKIVFGTGVGLQMYNFRFNRPVTYLNETTPEVFLDSVNTITKNKLGFTYLSVPLMMTFKTKAAKDLWLVYGVGVTGGYRIASWTKQKSHQHGKQKNHNKFNFKDFNSCVTAEFGLEGYFRLYASYQITALHEDVLDQHPLSIGLRFGGI